MPNVQVTLTESWILSGTTYLPGTHTLDESIADILVKAGATKNVTPVAPTAAEPVQRVGNPATPNADGDSASSAPSGEQSNGESGELSATPTLEAIVGIKAAASLAAAGYASYGDAIATDDATLSAIDGIGDATIKKLREYKAA